MYIYIYQFSNGATCWQLCVLVRETEEDAGGTDERWTGGAKRETETDSESP